MSLIGSVVELVLYLAVPVAVMAIGAWVMGRNDDRRVLPALSNRVIGFAFVAVGAIDLVIRVARATVLR